MVLGLNLSFFINICNEVLMAMYGFGDSLGIVAKVAALVYYIPRMILMYVDV